MIPKAGYLWDACKRKGISYRTYGEYADHPSLARPQQPGVHRQSRRRTSCRSAAT